jgi:vacuolar-type H+-ATPase subunit I/STV1
MTLQFDRPIEQDDDLVSNRALDQVEGELRDFIRRDRRKLRSLPATDASLVPSSDYAGSLVEQMSSSSIAEIDRAVAELQNMRDELQREAERVQQELASYAQVSQSALGSVRSISDSLAQWNRPADAYEPQPSRASR